MEAAMTVFDKKKRLDFIKEKQDGGNNSQRAMSFRTKKSNPTFDLFKNINSAPKNMERNKSDRFG